MNERESVCLLPRLVGLGGPVSFSGRLIAGLTARGIPVHHDPLRPNTAAILVIGGTRRLDLLWRARRSGVRIVQRLNGMNWVHRLRSTGWKHYLRSEVNNLLLSYIRRALADCIIYQSHFSQYWWEEAYGSVTAQGRVVYNAVDLQTFTPQGAHERPIDHPRLLLVEGRLGGANEPGLANAVALAKEMGGEVELVVAGEVPDVLRTRWQTGAGIRIQWAGVVKNDRVPFMDRSAHVLFSGDINAACPNSVIEALACGLPVIGFDTGALAEIVKGDAGRVVPYGGDHWRLEKADIPALAKAGREVIAGGERFRLAARRRAEEAFGVDQMVDEYLRCLL